MKSLRSVRSAVSVIICFALFCTLCSTWALLYQRVPDRGTTPPQSLGIATACKTTTTPYASLEDPTNITLGNPSPSSRTIPSKVWHSAPQANITENQREWTSSWTTTNPSFRQELLTDQSGSTFVREHFSSTRPDIVEVYEAIAIPILKADLLRYLIILAEGGVWSDLDVTCEKQIADWVPAEYQDHEIDMVVGLEFDLQWTAPGTHIFSQFSNWVFMARPSSRNLLVVVEAVIEKLREMTTTLGVGIEDLTLDLLYEDVVDTTGPKIMTVAILKGLGQLLGTVVDDRDFAGIKKPKLIGDVLIMPGNSFAARQNGFPVDQSEVLVTHHYEGSWKKADAEAKERKLQKTEKLQQDQTG
ncbi:hypothetical protein FE257_009464 [Aspergillus nanangensis]|uniref:Uncharacterized protein n=1 Tax=Aspergillus nanangensis TaxID=2582783 RepID=A0AAD4CLT4_ASPNN|nr:hypothetical protein FE257_009464 [Aspergillus nanangensis]